MASTLCRTVSTVARTLGRFSPASAQVRYASGQEFVGVGIKPVHKNKVGIDGLVASGGGHRVGVEKWELMCLEQGITDPYGLEERYMVDGTYEKPNLVPSFFHKRILGCVCDPDTDEMIWTWLEKGEPRRCRCGHWFQLIDMDQAVNMNTEPTEEDKKIEGLIEQ